MAQLKPGEHESWLQQYLHNRFAVTLLLLSFASAAIFFLVPTTILDLLQFKFDKIFTLENIVLLTLPLPFAFVTIHSLNGFRKESFSAFSALLLVPFGGKLALSGLTIALACPVVSWMAKNVYNQKNTFYTLYKATSIAVTVVAVLSASLFLSTYTGEPDIQETVVEQATNESVSLAQDILSQSFGDQDTLQLSDRKREEIVKQFVAANQLIVTQEMQEKGQNFTEEEYAIIRSGFDKAETQLLNQSQDLAVEEAAPATQQTIRGLVHQNLQKIAAPGPGTNIALFLIVFSLVSMLKIPFGLLGTFYASVLLHFHPNAPNLPEITRETVE